MHRFHAATSKRSIRAGILSLLFVLSASGSEPVKEDIVVVGIAAPNQEAVLGASLRGRVESVVASEGATVREGDLIFKLDDRVQQARVAMSRSAADSTLAIELAKAKWDKARRDLDRLTKLYGDDFSSSKEMSDAVADEAIYRIEYELAKFKHSQAKIEQRREEALLEQYNIRAPFDGYVAQHLKHPGEAAEEGEGVVRLTQLDPLTVAIDCPLGAAAELKVGDNLRVAPLDERLKPRIGTVTFVNRVADGASQTVRVKVSVTNTGGAWPADLKVGVELGAQAGRVADYSTGMDKGLRELRP